MDARKTVATIVEPQWTFAWRARIMCALQASRRNASCGFLLHLPIGVAPMENYKYMILNNYLNILRGACVAAAAFRGRHVPPVPVGYRFKRGARAACRPRRGPASTCGVVQAPVIVKMPDFHLLIADQLLMIRIVGEQVCVAGEKTAECAYAAPAPAKVGAVPRRRVE
jgi:hypothetical protein